MTSLKNKKEFIYKLGGKYYIIGECECKECEDHELINLYQEFVSLTEDKEFKDCDVRKMLKNNRNRVAEVYKDLTCRCYVSIEKSEMTDEKVIQREHLEEKYESEVDRQFERWIKADTCLFHKEIDELVKK